MLFLYFGDSHISAKTPISRIDNYQESIYNKIKEIVCIANNINADFIICGGDLFHSPMPTPNSVMVANNIAKLLISSKIPMYVVPGNHDQYGYNNLTLDKSLLGMYAASGVVDILDRSNPLVFNVPSGKRVVIEGQEYKIGIDKYNENDFKCSIHGDYNILVSHAMVSDGLVSKYYKKNEVNHIDISEIKTNANLVLTAHEHNGYEPKTTKDKKITFLNPGSIARTDSTLKHTPSIYIVKLNEELELSYEKVALKCAKSYDEIFDTEIKEETKLKNKLLEDFKNEILNINLNKTTNTEQIIYELANKSNFNDSLIDKTFKFMQQASEVNTNSSHIKKPYDIKIKEVHINNFQSHKNTIVKFNNELTTIIGDSDSGKTAIIRAIDWCLYNSMKGTEFIRTGEKECSVKVIFNDNSYILRSRDTKSSGKYIVCSSNGDLKEFEGFGNEIPHEVSNEHQMPVIQITKDYNMNVNMLKQLDGPFLLDKPSSVRASAVGKITNTDKIDFAIKDVSAKKKNVQKEIKMFESQKTNLEIDLLKFDDLSSQKRRIDKIDELSKVMKVIKDELDYMNRIKDNLKNLENKIKTLELEKSKFINIKELESKFNDSKLILTNLVDLNNYCYSLNDINNKINTLKNTLKNDLDIDTIKDKIEAGYMLLDDIQGYIKIKDSFDKCDFYLRTEIKNINNSNEHINKLTNDMVTTKATINELLDSLGICPTCGSSIDEHNKTFILNNK